eukprot:gene4229-7566_t
MNENEENLLEEDWNEKQLNKKEEKIKNQEEEEEEEEEEIKITNNWVEEVYLKVWKKREKNPLTMKELLERFIEPESPRWYYINVKNIKNPKVRIKCWKMIREELTLKLNDKKYNIYGYHNCAILSFKIGEREVGIKLLSKLINSFSSPTLLLTMSYFYIETNQIKNACAILYNLLNDEQEEEDKILHSLFLSMKLNNENKELKQKVMIKLCELKPNNHLYKLWKMKWEIKNEIVSINSKDEIIENTLNFLKERILEKESNHSFISFLFNNKYSIFLNILSSLFFITGLSLFIKNFLIPIWNKYKKKEKENKKYMLLNNSKDSTFNKISSIHDNDESKFKFKMIEEIENDKKFNSKIMNNFEYVDNLFSEIQYLINYKDTLPRENENKNIKISNDEKISVISMKDGFNFDK